MGISTEEIHDLFFLRDAYVNLTSLDAPVNEESDSACKDFIADNAASSPFELVSEKMLKETIYKILNTLTEREKQVLILRFGIYDGQTRTLDEIGKIFHLTRERIRQIEAKALKKLRHPSVIKNLKEWLI